MGSVVWPGASTARRRATAGAATTAQPWRLVLNPRIVRRRGAVLIRSGDVLISKILARPGPTHELLDILAATAVLAPGSRIALLGFGGGGILAPLRAMRCHHRVAAVDLSRASAALFWQVGRSWCGAVTVAHTDAQRWLARRRGRFDLIIEDLSIEEDGDVIKPAISFDALPELMARRLSPRGLVVVNLLPMPGRPAKTLLDRLRRPFRFALELPLTDYENRLLVAGGTRLDARQTSLRLRAALDRIRSRQARRFAVRTLPPPDPRRPVSRRPPR